MFIGARANSIADGFVCHQIETFRKKIQRFKEVLDEQLLISSALCSDCTPKWICQ